MPDSPADNSPSNQFSLKWIFVLTAVVAGFLSDFRDRSMPVLLMVYCVTCLAIAATGRGQKVGSVWRGGIAGISMPAGYAFIMLAEYASPSQVVLGCFLFGFFGLWPGIFAGMLVAD